MAQPAPLSTITPANFRQLHVKLPTETVREPAPEGWNGPAAKPSDVWLDAHASGFLLLHNRNPDYPMGRAMTLESVDTGELIASKRLPREAPKFDRKDRLFGFPKRKIDYHSPSPPELRFSTLDDPRVEVRLPDEPYFPKLYAYGYPLGLAPGETEEAAKSDVFSLYFKHYNGGSLDNFMEMYSDKDVGAPTPEPFIWHVIEQVSRAVLFLHKGYTREYLDACLVARQDEREGRTAVWPKVPDNAAKWTPIVHRLITAQHVLLHFPQDGDPLSRCFPQVVLLGFDQANLESDDKLWWSADAAANLDADKDVPPSPWEDMYLVGALFRQLVTIYDSRKHVSEHRLEEFNVDVDGKLSAYEPGNLNLATGQVPAYSPELISLLKRWEVPALQNDAAAYFSNPGVRGGIPTIQLIEEEALPLASRKVAEYRAMGLDQLTSEDGGGLMSDVSWVMPDPKFEVIRYGTVRLTEERALRTFENTFIWLYGPYIPVWYRYDAIDVSKICLEAHDFYLRGDHTRQGDVNWGDPKSRAESRGNDDDGGNVGDDENDGGGDGGGNGGGAVEDDGNRGVGNGGWDWTEPATLSTLTPEEMAELRDRTIDMVQKLMSEEDELVADNDDDDQNGNPLIQAAKDLRRQDNARIITILTAQDKFISRAKLAPVRVHGLPPIANIVPPPQPILNKAARKAHKEYKLYISREARAWERRIRSLTTRPHCNCANCIRELNLQRLDMTNYANSEIQQAHHWAIRDVTHKPQFLNQALSLPSFSPPLNPQDFLRPPVNPYDIESRVEEWIHSPFAAEYTEEWKPDEAYPWRQWEYPRAGSLLEDTSDEDDDDDDDNSHDDGGASHRRKRLAGHTPGMPRDAKRVKRGRKFSSESYDPDDSESWSEGDDDDETDGEEDDGEDDDEDDIDEDEIEEDDWDW